MAAGLPSLVIAFSLAVLMGAVLLMEGPVPGMWAIGTLVGINMLIVGLSIISIGSAGQGLAVRTSGSPLYVSSACWW